MKKTILLALLCIVGGALFAQDQTSSRTRGHMSNKLRWGLDVGVNRARFDVDAEEYANSSLVPRSTNKTSFHAGAFIDLPLGGMFSLKPEVMYSRQGSDLEVTTTSGGTSSKIKIEEDLAYVLLAPTVQFRTKPGIFLETGPVLGYLVGAEQDGPAPYNDNNMRDSRNKIDFLWSGGVGFMTKFGLGIHARYNYGFSNVLNNSGNAEPIGKLNNRLLQLGVSYHFGAQ